MMISTKIASAGGKSLYGYLTLAVIAFTGILGGSGALAARAEGLCLSGIDQSCEVQVQSPIVQEVPYIVASATSIGGNRLVLDCALPEPQNEDTLTALGDKLYADYRGGRYQLVTINWHLLMQPSTKRPWAKTSMTRQGAIQLMPAGFEVPLQQKAY